MSGTIKSGGGGEEGHQPITYSHSVISKVLRNFLASGPIAASLCPVKNFKPFYVSIYSVELLIFQDLDSCILLAIAIKKSLAHLMQRFLIYVCVF